jgi:hypothetical protein
MEEVERSVVVPGLGRLGERGGRVRKSHHCECTVGDDASVCRAVCALVISLKRDPRRQVGNEGCSLLGRLLHHGLAQTGDLHPPAPPAVLHRSPPFPPRRTASKRQREADRGGAAALWPARARSHPPAARAWGGGGSRGRQAQLLKGTVPYEALGQLGQDELASG